MFHASRTLAALIALAGCAQTVAPEADDAGAGPRANGQCTASEVTPAVYEQVMGQVMVVPEQRDAAGAVVHPPVYRNAPVPRLVRPRGEVRFPAPCPAQMTADFIASVQRALYARGYLTGTITREMDAATRAAIRRYQAERGLDSDQLSLDTARELGLVAVDLPQG